MTEKQSKVAIAELPMPFGNIAGNRYGAPPHLRREPEYLFLSKPFRKRVDSFRQSHRLLPNQQISEMPRLHEAIELQISASRKITRVFR